MKKRDRKGKHDMVKKDCRCCRDYCMVIEALDKERGISQLYGSQLQSHKDGS